MEIKEHLRFKGKGSRMPVGGRQCWCASCIVTYQSCWKEKIKSISNILCKQKIYLSTF